MSGKRSQPDDNAATVPAAGSEDERRPGLRAVGPAASRIAGPIVARHGGGIVVRLKSEWREVVGAETATATWPQALTRDGVLKLRVAPAMALELQHRAPLLIERLNFYLGRPVILRIALVQGPLPLAPAPPEAKPPPLGAGEVEMIERRVAEIPDPELRAALARLGKSVASRALPRR